MNGNTWVIEYSVPQSSVLGPILFNINTNDICEVNINGSIVTYADDTCLLFSHKTRDGVYEKALRGFSETSHRLNNRNLILNVEKTVFMPFSINKYVVHCNNISIHGCDVNKNKTCDSD